MERQEIGQRPELEPVPTVEALERQGLAEVAERNKSRAPTHYKLKPEGQALIYDTMKRNAAKWRAFNERKK